MGTFILSHLTDWDGDGVRDDNHADNCPITPNDPDDNANADAETFFGFPAVW
jgi:hypothetical protein